MKYILIIISLLILQFSSCKKIEYCLCDNKDNFIKFKVDKKSKCYTLNLYAGIIDNTERTDAINNGYVTQVQFIDYSKKKDSIDEQDQFAIVILDKKEKIYHSDEIFSVCYITNGITYSHNPYTISKYQTEFTIELIKVDEINKIITGKFNGKLANLNGVTINIKDGEFEINY